MKVFDPKQPIANPRLRQTMLTLRKNGGRLEEQVFFEALRKAELLAPVEIKPVSEDKESVQEAAEGEDVRVRFLMLHTQDKVAYLPAFTDEESLAKGNWAGGVVPKAMVVTLEDYCTMILSSPKGANGIVINPFEESLQVPRSTLARLNGKAVPHIVKKDTEVKLGEPKEYPQELVDAVKGYLKTKKEVSKAYLQQMIRDGEESYLLIVDFDGIDRKQLFEGIAEAASPYLKDKLLDMVPYTEAFGQQAAQKVHPFYSKKRFGLF